MNFLEIIKNYNITIPLIQRDYVQGNDEKKARDFLEAIKINKKLNLDFIYGYIEDQKFIPIDGQQRLTTLFLLYFYLEKDSLYLDKFNYELRGDVEDFLKELIADKKNILKENIKENIINSNWFYATWIKNPTIKAMLNMIDLIEEYFKEESVDKLKHITFSFLNINEIKQGEDIYIKLNARGKLLDDFENFKAEFENYIKEDEEYKNKFDKDWLDFFWEKAKTNANNVFFNFIKYIAEMLSYKNGLTKEFDYDLNKIINILQENKFFLKNTLDNIKLIDQFMNYFSKNYENGKLALFDKNPNILNKVLFNLTKKEDSPSIFDKILLFIIILYINKFSKIDDNLNNIIRSVRNILWQAKTFKQGEIRFFQTLGYKDINQYINLFEKFLINNFHMQINQISSKFAKKAMEKEKEKINLILKDKNFKKIINEFEDLEILKGDISNFLINDLNKLKNYLKAIKELFIEKKVDDSKLIRAMLTIDDYTIWIGKSNLVGRKDKYYFGREGYWDIILQAKNYDDDFNYKSFWQDFLDTYLNIGLDNMINNWLENNNEIDWMYYFIKYPQFTEKYPYKYISNDLNVFVFDENLNIEKLNSTKTIGYHISPFIYTVNKIINENLAAPAKGGDIYSALCLNYKCTKYILFINGVWYISIKNLPENIVKKYNLKKENNNNYYYILKTSKNVDQIKKMIKLLKEIFK